MFQSREVGAILLLTASGVIPAQSATESAPITASAPASAPAPVPASIPRPPPAISAPASAPAEHRASSIEPRKSAPRCEAIPLETYLSVAKVTGYDGAPDGKSVVYISDKSGTPQLYLQPLPVSERGFVK